MKIKEEVAAEHRPHWTKKPPAGKKSKTGK